MNKVLQFLRSLVGDDLIYQIIISLLVFLVIVLFAKLLSYLIRIIFQPVVKKSETVYDDLLLEIAEVSGFRLLLVLGAYVSLQVFRGGFNLINLRTKKHLIQEYPYLKTLTDIGEKVIFIILVIVILLVVIKLFITALDWYAEKIKADENKDLGGSLFPLIKKILRLILSVAAFVVILAKLNIDISAFLVSLGVGSLAIALAAQETISNMISGFIIMTDRPFRIGDRVKIGTDILGDVVGIGIRSTKIIDFDKNIIIIPNNEIVKSKIINITYPDPLTRVLVDITVKYGIDFDRVKVLLLEIADSDERISKDVQPEVYITRFADSGLDLRMAVYTPDYKNAFNVQITLREVIYKRFTLEGIEIPYPRRDIYISNSPTHS